jgi:two-component sensor histidine kinase
VLCVELRALAASELDALVLASLTLRTREERLDRLRAAADSLSSEQARHLAYRLSVVTALADLASADEEFEFDLDVQDALHLSSDDADRLTAEVNEALLDQG